MIGEVLDWMTSKLESVITRVAPPDERGGERGDAEPSDDRLTIVNGCVCTSRHSLVPTLT